jgi:hypothetical protein
VTRILTYGLVSVRKFQLFLKISRPAAG